MTMLLGLFTSRVTLNALGVNDYGILSVVGGVIGFLDILSNRLNEATSRFLTIDLGKADDHSLKLTFSACLTIHIVLSIVVLVLGETIGLWFVNYRLTIDSTRLLAANIVYQTSLLSAAIAIVKSPFLASIVSHEEMSTFAFMSIFDVIIRLLIVFLLLYVDCDKLILYSVFYVFVSILIFSIYYYYCRYHFQECRFRWRWDMSLYQEIWHYVGWNFIGGLAFIANNHGITVLLNLFFNTAVNAARGIVTTLCGQVEGFVANFMTAVRPQIVKNYAVGNLSRMNSLIINSARYSSFILLILALPIVFEADFLVNLWLGQVPEYVVPFLYITLAQQFFRSIGCPVGYGIHAFGKMKLPNITSSIVYLSSLPISYFCLKQGCGPKMAYLVSCIVYPSALLVDLLILRKYSGFKILPFVKDVILRTLFILTLSSIVPALLRCRLEDGWSCFIIVVISCLAISLVAIYFIGLDKSMRSKVWQYAKNKIQLS